VNAVLAVANAIGLTAGPGGDAFGTVEEEVVLEALTELATAHPGNDDLFAEAAARVQLARSAGVERIEPNSVFAYGRDRLDIQLRYRSEMLEVFQDLAIDLALRHAAVPAASPSS
jgi:CRP-like cAMP-binding protein